MKEVIGIELVTSENPKEAEATAIEQGELALKVSKKKKFEEYEISNAVDTLLRAEEIKQNEELMVPVREAMEKKGKAFKKISSLKELRSRASQKSGEANEVDEEKGDE